MAYSFKTVNVSSENVRQQLEKTHKQHCTHAIGLFSKLQELLKIECTSLHLQQCANGMRFGVRKVEAQQWSDKKGSEYQ